MLLYAADLIDFLNRDWGTGTLGCVDSEYLKKFTTIQSGKFTPPADPDAVVDLDLLNAVAISIVVKDNTSVESRPLSLPYVTLVRLCQLLGIRPVGQIDPPSSRGTQPELPFEPVKP
jgi:hypothetical protein